MAWRVLDAVFKTDWVDAPCDRFPDRLFLDQLLAEEPADLLFALNVTD